MPWERFRLRAWPLLVLITLAAVYATAYGEFVGRFFSFDDFAILGAADHIHVRGPADLLRFFEPTPSFTFYRPLTTIAAFWAAEVLLGVDPTRWSVVLLGAHVVNAMLGYAIVSRLLGSRLAGLAAALVYASAPGHALAARWFAYFSVTGTVLAYFAGLCIWLYAAPRHRTPATLAAYVMSLLCSEHAASFPLAVTAVAVLAQGRRDWRQLGRDLAPLWVVGTAYVAAKAVYLFVLFPRRDPMAAALFRAYGYGLSFAPLSTLETLGRYVAAAVAPLYAVGRSSTWYRGAGVLTVGLAVIVVGMACGARWRGTWLGVAACGILLFFAGLGPVLFLPQHVYGAYVGVAALGAALAIVAPLTALPRGSAVALAVAAVFVAVHLGRTAAAARTEEDFRMVDQLGLVAARWLSAVDHATDSGTEEVVVPLDQVTERLFGVGHRLFLCASYEVRAVPDVQAVTPRPGLVVVERATRPLPGEPQAWRAVVHHCPG